MSGHSKWSTIKHKKALVDAKRGKAFTKVLKEITVAARMGGGDPDANPRLRTALSAGRSVNLPRDNADRAIKKGTGDLEGVEFMELTYEGYGPGGIAMFVEVTSDNKNRIVGEIRFAFTRCNGNLGQDGSVGWMFDRKGQIVVQGAEIDEDELMMEALESGAEDVAHEDDLFLITTGMADLYTVHGALEDKYNVIEAALARIPQNTIKIDAKLTKQVLRLIETLEENDDVQNVFHNAEFDDGGLG